MFSEWHLFNADYKDCKLDYELHLLNTSYEIFYANINIKKNNLVKS